MHTEIKKGKGSEVYGLADREIVAEKNTEENSLEIRETEEGQNIREESGVRIYDILPSSPILYLLLLAVSYNSKERKIPLTGRKRRLSDRHKEITCSYCGHQYEIRQDDLRSGDKISIRFTDYKHIYGKAVKKCLVFLLSEYNRQNFSSQIGFSLCILVDRGMYSSIDNARRGLKSALESLGKIKIRGTIAQGPKLIIEQREFAALISGFSITNNYVQISVNEDLNKEFIAPYYALLPEFSYSLSSGKAFDLCVYIFLQARQNTKAIKAGGGFNISLRKISELLALPRRDDIKNKRNWKPKQYVVEPILQAVRDISDAAQRAGFMDLKLEIIGNPNFRDVNDFLSGYLRVSLSGEIYDKLCVLAMKKEEKVKQIVERNRSKSKKQTPDKT